jgi:hypothetical protein
MSFVNVKLTAFARVIKSKKDFSFMFASSILIIIVALLVLLLGIENPARVWAAKIEVERK